MRQILLVWEKKQFQKLTYMQEEMCRHKHSQDDFSLWAWHAWYLSVYEQWWKWRTGSSWKTAAFSNPWISYASKSISSFHRCWHVFMTAAHCKTMTSDSSTLLELERFMAEMRKQFKVWHLSTQHGLETSGIPQHLTQELLLPNWAAHLFRE